MRRLIKLHGVGAEFATVLTQEVFYRPFQNRRQVAGYVGLTPPPYDSGETKHDQGINKAGNTRARVIAAQMAWLWLRYQSKSDLSLWVGTACGLGRAVAWPRDRARPAATAGPPQLPLPETQPDPLTNVRSHPKRT